MRASAKALLQVCVVLVCAIGASFSGDLYAHHGQVSHRGSRPTRGSRSVSRSSQSDQFADIEAPHDEQALAFPAEGSLGNELPAIVPSVQDFIAEFVQVATAEPVAVHVVHAAHSLARFGRAPPVLL
jgi:hypothetical protein